MAHEEQAVNPTQHLRYTPRECFCGITVKAAKERGERVLRDWPHPSFEVEGHLCTGCVRHFNRHDETGRRKHTHHG